MPLRLANVTFDAADPPALAAFWAAALGHPIDPVDPKAAGFFASIDSQAKDRPTWLFLKVPEDKAAKNRVHVDLEADDREAEVTRLVALGATRVADHQEWGMVWTVLTDPEGNEFCVGGGGH